MMKGRKNVTVVGAVFLVCIVLSGCAGGSDDAISVDSLALPSEVEPTPEAMGPFTLKEKVESVLDDDGPLPGVSENSGDGGFWARVDGKKYCVGAVYPTDDWTPAEIAASYLNQSAPWVETYDAPFLWSADYEHEFCIKDFCTNNVLNWYENWLYVDGYRTLPLYSPVVDDISPEHMVELYQSGQWNGYDLIYDANCPGLAVDDISYDGTIAYVYDAREMPEDVLMTIDMLADSWDFHWYDNSDLHGFCHASVYPDFPGGLYIEKGFGAQREDGASGTYITVLERDDSKEFADVTGARVERYVAGELVQTWDLTPEKEVWLGGETKLICNDGEYYFYYRDTLWRLHPDGEIEVLLEHFIDYDWLSEVERVFYDDAGNVVYIPPRTDEDEGETEN